MKNRRALLYAIIAAVLAFAFQCAYMARYEQRIAGAYEPIAALIAVRNIPPGVPLDDSMVEIQKIPKKYLQPKYVHNLDSLFGQIAAAPILKGEQIVQTKLLSIEEAGLARKVPPGHRAIAVAVDDITGVGGHLRPGNHIDIVGTFDFGDNSKHDMKAIVLLQNVEVLSVGAELAQAVPLAEEQARKGVFGGRKANNTRFTGSGKSYGNVTIGVTPGQVPKVILAQEVGTLTLALLKSSFQERSGRVRVAPMGVSEALGLPKKVYRRARPSYREIRAGGY